jgi:hypothetical protein
LPTNIEEDLRVGAVLREQNALPLPLPYYNKINGKVND